MHTVPRAAFVVWAGAPPRTTVPRFRIKTKPVGINITRRPPQVVHQLCTRSRARLATKLDWEVARFTKKRHVFVIYVYICPREATRNLSISIYLLRKATLKFSQTCPNFCARDALSARRRAAAWCSRNASTEARRRHWPRSRGGSILRVTVVQFQRRSSWLALVHAGRLPRRCAATPGVILCIQQC